MSRLARALTAARDFFYEPAAPVDPPFTPAEAVAKLRELVGDEFFELHPVTAEQITKALGGEVPQMPATPVTKPVGANGLGIYGGYPVTAERSPDLMGTERYRKFEEWKRLVAEVGMAVREWLLLAGAPWWKVRAYKADDAEEALPEDKLRAAWLQRQLYGMATEWARVVMEHALAPVDGSRLGVWTFKLMPAGDLAKYGLADIMTIPLSTIERWDVDTATGRLRGIVQRDPDSNAEIPIARERLVYSRDLPTTTHPAGDGVMRFLAETIRRLLKLEALLDKGFARDVNGVPIVYAPILEKMAMVGKLLDDGKTTYTKAMFERDMKDAVAFVSADKRKDAGLILDSSTFKDVDGNPTNVRRFAAEVLSAAGTSHAELRGRVKDLGWNVLAMLNAEHKAMGRDNGTQGMHQSKESGRLRAVSSFLNGFAETIRRDLVRMLWIFNGWDLKNPDDPQNLPTLTWNVLEFADSGSTVQSVSALLTAAGIEPGRADNIVNAILENQGLPTLEAIDSEAVMLAREAALDRAGMGQPKEEDEEVEDDPEPEAAPSKRGKDKT